MFLVCFVLLGSTHIITWNEKTITRDSLKHKLKTKWIQKLILKFGFKKIHYLIDIFNFKMILYPKRTNNITKQNSILSKWQEIIQSDENRFEIKNKIQYDENESVFLIRDNDFPGNKNSKKKKRKKKNNEFVV